MGWFNRKKKVTPELPSMPPVAPPCSHKWRDFSWYSTATYYSDVGELNFRIYEPYVCIHCKKRKDEILLEVNTRCSYDDALARVKEEEETYKTHLKARAFVEDEIKDMQLVDRDYLHIAQGLYPNRPIELKLES